MEEKAWALTPDSVSKSLADMANGEYIIVPAHIYKDKSMGKNEILIFGVLLKSRLGNDPTAQKTLFSLLQTKHGTEKNV